MTPTALRYRSLRLGTAAVFAALLFAAACELTPRSTGPSPTEPTLAEVVEGKVEDEESEVVRLEYVPIATRISPDGVVTHGRILDNGDTVWSEQVQVRIRRDGLGFGDANPVILVDGVRVESVSTVDPTRIRSIEVLKGEAALAAYGPEAADGLIRVTTGTPESRPRPPQPAQAPAAAEEIVAVPATASRAQALEGVVAVGYGVKPRDGAAAPAPAAELDSVVAVGYGTEARASADRPASRTIRIRGALTQAENPTVRARDPATATAAQPQPLILVDGEVVSSLAELHERFEPGEIASISVIKDAAALEAYGARARHGAVIVTLKK